MKKILAFVLTLILVISFAACAKDEGVDESSKMPTSSAEIINIAEYASKGEIKGCEYALGTSPDVIKSDYHYGDDEFWGMTDTVSSRYNIDAVPLDVREYEDGRVRFTTSDAKFYYHSSQADKGISYIAQFHDAYGLKVGIADTDSVKNAITDVPVFDGFAASEDLFFFFDNPENVYSLKYKFVDYELSFYFVDGKLSATCLKNTVLWDIDTNGGNYEQ